MKWRYIILRGIILLFTPLSLLYRLMSPNKKDDDEPPKYIYPSS